MPLRPLQRLTVAVGALALLSLAAGSIACHQLTTKDPVDRLEWIKRMVRSDFPDVERISTGELQRRLEQGETPVLLDVRRADEYAVSHLPGALRVEPGSTRGDLDPTVVRAIDDAVRDGRPIVAYCSVGYRSAQLAEALPDEVPVTNLEGSIFEWAARGYPMVTAGGAPTETVHPYGRAWAWLVDEELRAWTP